MPNPLRFEFMTYTKYYTFCNLVILYIIITITCMTEHPSHKLGVRTTGLEPEGLPLRAGAKLRVHCCVTESGQLTRSCAIVLQSAEKSARIRCIIHSAVVMRPAFLFFAAITLGLFFANSSAPLDEAESVGAPERSYSIANSSCDPRLRLCY